MKSSKAPTQIYQLKISLRDITPPIWRSVQVKSSITLDKLHDVIQHVMGWTDSHLHMFNVNGELVGTSVPEDDLFYTVSERSVRLDEALVELNSSVLYIYDFGDDWLHDVVLERVVEHNRAMKYPVCVAGERACPPEDCGSVPGYYSMLESLADKSHPEHESYMEWTGGGYDPEAFNIDKVNEAL